MRSLLIYNLFLALAILISASPFQNSQLLPYQAGFSKIYFETDIVADTTSDRELKKFTISYSKNFQSQLSAVISVAGTEGIFGIDAGVKSSTKVIVISIKISQLQKQSLVIEASKMGKVNSVQVAYLIFSKKFEHESGVWFWNQSYNKKEVSSESHKDPLKISLNEVEEHYKSKTTTSLKTYTIDRDLTSRKILKIVPMMASFVISEQILGQLVEVSYLNQSKTIQLQVKNYQFLREIKFEVLFTLLVQFSLSKTHSEAYRPNVMLETRVFTINDDQRQLGSPGQKVLLVGLNCFNQKSQVIGVSIDVDYEFVWFTTHPQFTPESSSKEMFSYSLLVIKQQKYYFGRLLDTCPTGTYQAGTNWNYNSITSWPTNDCRGSCSGNCRPCPIGCITCIVADCSWKVSCTQCNSTGNFTAVKTGCSNNQYSCNCPADLFPDMRNKNCSTCAQLIPNCQSCVAANQFIGTYCSSCNLGYMKVLVWFKDGIYYSNVNSSISICQNCDKTPGSGYARACVSCAAGCSVCTSTTSCTTCFNNLIPSTGGTCTCNTTAGLFYNSTIQSCVTCSTLIPGCLTCSLTTPTTCSTCSPGYYRDPTTLLCVKCSTYCALCTSTACTNCTSSTFTISTTNCICASPLFLKTTPTPATCQSCSYFQTHCTTCQNSTGVVLCDTCATSYYNSAGTCLQCMPLCVSCLDSLTCLACSDPTTMDVTNNCDCITGYVLLPSSSTCVLCSVVIPNCNVCDSATSFCTGCANPYYLSGGSPACAPCLLGCTTCINGTYCTACIPGYSFVIPAIGNQYCDCISADCINCPVSSNISTCTYCNPALTSQCLSCAPGSYLTLTNTCLNCPNKCTSCSDITCPTCVTTCITCDTTFTLINGRCLCNNALQEYYNINTNTCTTCGIIDTLSCTATSSCCTSCVNQYHPTTGFHVATICTACPTGWYPDPNSIHCSACPSTCISCTNSATCLTCQPSYFILPSTGSNVCTCDTASQYFSNPPNGCQQCGVIISGCITCASDMLTPSPFIICTQCQNGYYIDPVTQFCVPCPSTCDTCNSGPICTSCVATYSLMGGTMCACNNTAQVYQAGGYCAACYTFIPYCTTCTLNVATVECTVCGVGTYASSTTTCSLCGSNCLSCTSSTTCQSCVPGFDPVPPAPAGGICTFSNQCASPSFTNPDPNCAYCGLSASLTTICVACKAGYYVDNQVSCVACPSTCDTCTDYLTCLICQPTFTLKNGACVCDQSLDQVLLGSICVSCSSQKANCATCSSNVAPVTCTACIQTFTLVGATCSPCTYGCLACDSTLTLCTDCIPGFTLSGNTCINGICSIGHYFDSTVLGSCVACGTNCNSCLSATQCLTCSGSNMVVSGGQCKCDTTNGYFYNLINFQCVYCGTVSAGNPSGFPLNCAGCVITATAVGFQCSVCNVGFYLSSGSCASCAPGCSQCTGIASCSSCIAPQYAFSSGNCICNQNANYFLNVGGTACQLCSLTNCTVCSSLISCAVCISGSFVNITTSLCQPQICGNGRLEGIQQCDDNNTLNGDGCDFDCDIQPYFVCINLVEGALSQCLPQNNKFKLQITAQQASCNKITIKLENIGTEDISICDISSLLNLYQFQYTTLESYSMSGKSISYTFTYNHSIQGIAFNLVFDPSHLCVTNAAYFPPFNATATVSPTNNRPALYYPEGQCESHQTLKKITSTIQYASYATLFLSALPCKIVGLQLFGVLQLAFLSLGSLNDINLMLQPLTDMGGVNGYHLDLGGDKPSRLLQSFTPERINAINYKANFVRNCNVMLLLVLAVISVAFLLYLLTYIFKNCAPSFHKVAKRLIKEVLLTLILFNALNFAYTAGVHFRYAPSNDPLYYLGTLAAIGTLVIPILMAIALLCTEEDGFGQFKDKLKAGCLEKAYFVITIVYRMGIGLYMSSANEDNLSTLILLAFSIFFVVYNLVNLPFTKAYHNYRANICHITQFVILYVAMYYRSMKSTSPLQETASIFSPVYFEYVCIFASLVVSFVVLVYEIYLFVKECCCSSNKDVRNTGQAINKTENQNSQIYNQSGPQIMKEQEKQSAEYVFDECQ